MFTPVARFSLILGCLAIGVWWLSTGEWMGIFVLFAAACFGFGYFRYGTVWLAFRALREGNIDKAENLISKVSYPSKLNSQNRAYYNWAKGAVAMRRGDFTRAKEFLELAAAGKLRTSNDRSILACFLAEIAVRNGDHTTARNQLEKARLEPHKHEVDRIISNVEKMMQAEV
jgi:hypothetical protein